MKPIHPSRALFGSILLALLTSPTLFIRVRATQP
jgi:hypothetical protein